jgi:hypothetical protein
MKSHRIQRTTFLSSLTAIVASAGILLCGGRVHAQPVIGNAYPDGVHQFEPSSTLNFTATSSLGVTNVSVALTVTTLTGLNFLQIYSSSSGLTVTGPATNQNVSAPLSSNTLYAAVITATDASGTKTTVNLKFDTISPSYTFEAEDWDYTSTGGTGQFIDNPQTNQYAGLKSTSGVDYNNASPGSGNSSYRPQGMETEVGGDIPRLPYIGTTNVDYDVGFGTVGGWANYTRHYPAGTYNVYGRLADGGSAQTDTAQFSVVASASGNAQLIGVGPFAFADKVTGWQTYSFYPLTDANGALVQFTNDGTLATLQLTAPTGGGSYNANFYMLMPVNTNAGLATTVQFTGVYPDGATQFQDTNTLTFTVTSAVAISPQDVVVQLSGNNLLGQSSATIFAVGAGLTLSGVETNFTCSIPLASNTAYSAFVQVIDANGTPGTTTLTFDTVIPFYTWEGEDFDYDSGLFFDNPQTNAYAGMDGVAAIDYYVDDPTSGTHAYRNTSGPETEPNGDIPRQAYTNGFATGFVDYDIGFNDAPNWENYTRHYPNGTFNIYVRGANGGGGAGTGGMDRVTSGFDTNDQTVTPLGSFTYPSTGNWQVYVWSPLTDASGNFVKVTFSGTNTETLRALAPSSGNVNYYMLEPADTTLPTVPSLYPNGQSLFQRTNTLSFVTTSSSGIATSAIVVTLNGTALTNLVFTGSSTNWTVTYTGLQPNTVYTTTISIKTLAGASYNQSFTFDTYSPNYYQFESADYDYTGANGVPGQYFDNSSGLDLYAGLGATPNIDELEALSGVVASEQLYRTNASGALAGDVIVTTQSSGDGARAQFGTNAMWRINWIGYPCFCNYTRHYPAGSYNVVARFTEGGANTAATLSKVTSGYGTATQTTSLLGIWNIPLVGWGAWTYETLEDTNGNPVTVTFDSSQTTLQVGGNTYADGQNYNMGFMMLVPVAPTGLTLTAAVSGTNITISFPTATGSTYQVQYVSTLSSTNWTPIVPVISGNDAVQSVQYPANAGSERFYRVQVQ